LPRITIELTPGTHCTTPHPNLAVKEKVEVEVEAEATRVSPSLHPVVAVMARLSGNLGAR
jgi:hypothetical protein